MKSVNWKKQKNLIKYLTEKQDFLINSDKFSIKTRILVNEQKC